MSLVSSIYPRYLIWFLYLMVSGPIVISNLSLIPSLMGFLLVASACDLVAFILTFQFFAHFKYSEVCCLSRPFAVCRCSSPNPLLKL